METLAQTSLDLVGNEVRSGPQPRMIDDVSEEKALNTPSGTRENGYNSPLISNVLTRTRPSRRSDRDVYTPTRCGAGGPLDLHTPGRALRCASALSATSALRLKPVQLCPLRAQPLPYHHDHGSVGDNSSRPLTSAPDLHSTPHASAARAPAPAGRPRCGHSPRRQPLLGTRYCLGVTP